MAIRVHITILVGLGKIVIFFSLFFLDFRFFVVYLHCKPITIQTMKKEGRNSRLDDLLIDVIEYAFTEWLIRRGIFVAFKSNYKRAFVPWKSFRDRLRSHIRHSLQNSSFGPSHLISSAFLFASTPEGIKFWAKQQAAWERFYAKFQTKF